MLRKKVAESLTVRIFLITTCILLFAGGITFGLIAWATPSTYTAVVNDNLTEQVDTLTKKLATTTPENCGALLDEFILLSGANAILVGPDGNLVDTGAKLMVQAAYEDEDMIVTTSEGDTTVSYTASETQSGDAMTITMSEQSAIAVDVRFAGSQELYALYVTPRMEAENLAVRAMGQIVPWLLVALLVFSLLCALIYSRYITRPIVRLSGIAGKMIELDFQWTCDEMRKDEIGQLGRSLNEMSRRLGNALNELKMANQTLKGEVERERELDRQRMAFFSAASHELKTPVTILKGQLAGMLEGVGVYQNRDKYLLRSLQVTGRMEKLIQEMLSISRMESGLDTIRREMVNLSALVERQLAMDAELLQQRGQRLKSNLATGLTIVGDSSLLGKVVGNLLSNASLYSPEGAEICLWCGMQAGRPVLTVENTGAQISEEALPRLFEPFFREEGSRNRSTGGSGLGLYLVKTILERHGATCIVANTDCGVKATVFFSTDLSQKPMQPAV